MLAAGIWLLLAERQRNRILNALALSVSAAALSAVVCGLTDSPVKFAAYAVIMTPVFLVVLLGVFPSVGARRGRRRAESSAPNSRTAR